MAADAADGGAYGQERGEFGAEAEEAAKERHESQRADDFDEDEQEAYRRRVSRRRRGGSGSRGGRYAGFEPEFVGGNAGFEDFSEAEDVGDGEAEEDGPEDVFDVGEGPVVGFGVEIDIFFEEFAAKPMTARRATPGIRRRNLVEMEMGGFCGRTIASAMMFSSILVLKIEVRDWKSLLVHGHR